MTSTAAPRPRRARTATESLLAVALGMEVVVVFFVTLTAFGLRALPAGAAFGGGAVLIVLLVVAAGAVRFAWGRALGWVLQAALIATGVILPVMYFIGAGFAAIWVFCFVKGGQLDAAKLAHPESTQGDQQ
ncbi:MAG TPA: DUF4233 domain-containing protein [Rhodoglobus sp.]|nr:DUF4233 domain-containing protein [Rhodoglobus sp.]